MFRCIPCEAFAQLDQEIVERDLRVQALLDQYVCVRVVQANAMDLRLFQFDYDQSFAAFLMNGDKTIYGRYGTRSHQTESDDDVSLEGFAAASRPAWRFMPAIREQVAAGRQATPTQPRYGTPSNSRVLRCTLPSSTMTAKSPLAASTVIRSASRCTPYRGTRESRFPHNYSSRIRIQRFSDL